MENNPTVRDFAVHVPSKRRPIVLLGLSATTDYIDPFAEALKTHCQTSGFSTTLNVHSIHLSPQDRMTEDKMRLPVTFIDWERKHDPMYVAAWVDVTDLKSDAAWAFFTIYGNFVRRLGDPVFAETHDASLE